MPVAMPMGKEKVGTGTNEELYIEGMPPPPP